MKIDSKKSQNICIDYIKQSIKNMFDSIYNFSCKILATFKNIIANMHESTSQKTAAFINITKNFMQTIKKFGNKVTFFNDQSIKEYFTKQWEKIINKLEQRYIDLNKKLLIWMFPKEYNLFKEIFSNINDISKNIKNISLPSTGFNGQRR